MVQPPSILQCNDYRAYLAGVLDFRTQKNPSYSLRAFARDLDLSPSRLSEVISKNHNLSLASASHVVKVLGMKGEQSAQFLDLVRITSGKGKNIGETRQRVEARREASQARQLENAQFALIADWSHWAIVELLKVHHGHISEANIAAKLGLEAEQVTLALERLTLLEYVAKEPGGRYAILTPRSESVSKERSEALNKYNNQLLGKARMALREQPVDKRQISGTIMAIDSARAKEAKAALRNFVTQFVHEFSVTPASRDKVYALSLAFFDLETQDPPPA